MRLLKYLVTVAILSVLVNLPKFFEAELVEREENVRNGETTKHGVVKHIRYKECRNKPTAHYQNKIL